MTSVTAIIPVYNRRRRTKNALCSVINQDYCDLRCIIVDDGSENKLTDDLTWENCNHSIDIIRQERNRGVSSARNLGAELANSEYLAFLDSDDVWHPEKLKHQIKWMADNRYEVSTTGFTLHSRYHPLGETRITNAILGKKDLVWGCGLSPGSTLVVSRSLFRRIGNFDEALRRLEDWDWLLRCSEHVKIHVYPKSLASIYIGQTQISLDHHVQASDIILRYIMTGRYALTLSQKHIIRGTLHIEKASAFYRNSYYGSALLSLLKSVYYRPIARRRFYERIAKAVVLDLKDR